MKKLPLATEYRILLDILVMGHEADLGYVRSELQKLDSGTDMEQAKPKSQDKVTSKPPKHSCTAEIIAELERLPVMRKGLHTPQKELDIILADTVRQRIAKLKAKETQL